MKILVIPDVHLKPWMFTRAEEILEEGKADRAVCLMDIADDWQQEWQIALYEQTYDAAIRFARTFPKTLWCYGNHDVSYLWQYKETGYSPIAPRTVCEKLDKLRHSLRNQGQLAFLHRVDNLLFSHGGLIQIYVDKFVPEEKRGNIDDIIKTINRLRPHELWRNDSPLWYRPGYCAETYADNGIIQVVGHTPVEKVTRTGNMILCDVFSTDSRRNPIGTQVFPIVDSMTGEYTEIR